MTEKMNALKAMQNKLQLMSAVVIIVILVSFLGLLVSYSLGIAGFLLSMAFYMLVIRKKKNDYKKLIKKTILEESYRKFLKNVSFIEKDGIDKSEVKSMGFLPVEEAGQVFVKDTVKGTYQNRAVTLSEVTTNFRSVKTKKSGADKSFVDYMSGVLFDIELAKDSGLDLLLWRKDAMSEAAFDHFVKGYDKISLVEEEKKDKKEKKDSSDTALSADEIFAKAGKKTVKLNRFEDMYDLYVRGGEMEKEQLLSSLDGLLKSFASLCSFTPGQPALQLKGNHLHIFVRTRFLYTIEIPVRTELTEKVLSFLDFTEISYLLRVADTLMKK